MNNVLIVAGKELRDGLRNRWLLAITVVFAGLALGIAYFGAAASGKVGFTSLSATIASLATLAGFVVPLISLLIAYDTVVGERGNGTLLLMLSYPISRTELLAGKFLGHSAVLALASVLGFGGAVAAMQVLSPVARSAEIWGVIALFSIANILLAASFAGMGCLISVLTRDKSRAAGLALLSWFVFVVLFDLALLAVLVFSGGNAMERAVFPYLLMLNPIDVFRLVSLEALPPSAGNVFVAMTGQHGYNAVTLYGALLFWSVFPFSLALLRFRRQEV